MLSFYLYIFAVAPLPTTEFVVKVIFPLLILSGNYELSTGSTINKILAI